MSKTKSYISGSLKGISRSINQDRVMILNNKRSNVFAVFDGVSSYPESYKYIENFIYLLKEKNDKEIISKNNITAILTEIHKELLNLPFRGMSTLCLILIDKTDLSKIYYLNVGDSPLYAITPQSITKLTKDDVSYPGSNVLTKCLGAYNLFLEDFDLKQLKIPEKILLCTDGFANLMEKDIKSFFNAFQFKRLTTIKNKLMELQEGKNNDDSTFILIKNEL